MAPKLQGFGGQQRNMMPVAETFSPTSINLSARAVRKVLELVTEEENDELKLRVFITGGGCSGLSYMLDFTEERQVVTAGTLKKLLLLAVW